jgi:hypothetical protein
MLAAMPVSYVIDRRASRIRTRCVGYTTLPETLEHFAILAADPECPPVADVLLDVDEITSLPAPQELREVARRTGTMPRVSFRNLAIVARRDDLVGMLRMLQVYAQRAFAAIEIFETEEAGEAWLDGMAKRE